MVEWSSVLVGEKMRRSKIGRLVTLAGQLVQDLLNFAINNSCKGRRPGVTMRWGDAFLRERDGKRIGSAL